MSKTNDLRENIVPKKKKKKIEKRKYKVPKDIHSQIKVQFNKKETVKDYVSLQGWSDPAAGPAPLP